MLANWMLLKWMTKGSDRQKESERGKEDLVPLLPSVQKTKYKYVQYNNKKTKSSGDWWLLFQDVKGIQNQVKKITRILGGQGWVKEGGRGGNSMVPWVLQELYYSLLVQKSRNVK